MAEKSNEIWKKFIKKHFQMLVLMIVACILAFMVTVGVFLWFVADAQSTGLVPELLGEWSIGYVITFILNLIFWEIILVVIPVIIAIALIYFLWWKKLPEKERKEYKEGHLFFGGRKHRTDIGGGISFLINIFFIIKVYLDGNWGLVFQDWEFDYLVYSYLWALIWVLIIFGVPMLIGGLWWLSRKMKK